MKTCDFCKKEIMYDCSAILMHGIVKIYACDDHKYIATSKRDDVLLREQWKERAKAFTPRHMWGL